VIDAGEAQIDWVKALIYGPSGAGKTSLIASLPDPVLVLLTEKHGAMTIKRVNPNAKIVFIEDQKICKCHRGPALACPDGAKEGITEVKGQDVLYGVLRELSTKQHPFNSVALDSLTDMQQILLSDMKGGKPGAKVALQEWGALIDRTKDLVVKLRNLNMHVAVICLADEVQDNTQRLVYRPALAGKKLPGNLIQYFNLCAFQRKTRDSSSLGGATYESVFDSGPEYYTKTHPALDPIEVPNVRTWVSKMATYATDHGEGDMPTESSPSAAAQEEKREEAAMQARLDNPKIKELFDKLQAPDAKRRATLTKHRVDSKVIEILSKRVAEMEAKAS
jgi:hypothetical protein